MSEFMNAEAQKNFAIENRTMFFNEIEAKLSIPPGEIDAVMCQNQHYITPKKARISNPSMGNLLIDIDTGQGVLMYSIYQIGKILRIGVLMSESLFQYGLKHEYSGMWGSEVTISPRGKLTMVEWAFDEPDLLGSWSTQEKYVLGIRHMHFRLLTALKENGIIF
jgi:hypothetical protein